MSTADNMSQSLFSQLFALGCAIGAIAVFLPCSYVEASFNGQQTDFYSSVLNSYIGPASLVMFVLAFFLAMKRLLLPASILGLLAAGGEVYVVLGKLEETRQKVTGLGYTIVHAYNLSGYMIGLLAAGLAGIFGIACLIGSLTNR